MGRKHETPEEAYRRGYDEGYVQGRLSKARETADVKKPHPGVLRPVMEQTADASMVAAFGVELGAPVRVVRTIGGEIAGCFQTGPVPEVDDHV